MTCSKFWRSVLLAGVAVSIQASHVLAEDWGTLTGQFVFDGDIPKTLAIDTKGKDANVCIPGKVVRQDLIIEKKTKGIGNIFVYLRKAPKSIHPDLKASKQKEVIFNQKNCMFEPRALCVRTDQTVLVRSGDATSHNFHSYTLKNQPVNFIIPGVNRVGIPVKKKLSESLPMEVKCDVHPWMKANWLITDHPYATASSVKDGKFKIVGLPVGDHEFRVWQERVGYVDVGGKKKGRMNVTIKKGDNKLPVIKLNIKKLTEEDA